MWESMPVDHLASTKQAEHFRKKIKDKDYFRTTHDSKSSTLMRKAQNLSMRWRLSWYHTRCIKHMPNAKQSKIISFFMKFSVSPTSALLHTPSHSSLWKFAVRYTDTIPVYAKTNVFFFFIMFHVFDSMNHVLSMRPQLHTLRIL
jgi:penicillin-binding protein-related factor A (putative recombinase)